MDTFVGLKMAYEAAAKGGNIPTALNAANEYAVALFLDRKIKYLQIYDMIRFAMDNVRFIDNPTVEEILETEQEVYKLLKENFN